MEESYQFPLDMDYLDILTDSDYNEEKKVCEMFLKQMKESINELEESFKMQDNHEWKRISHRMKGSSASLGAMILFGICKNAEHNSTCNNAVKKQYLVDMRNQLGVIIKFLDQNKEGELND